MSNSQGIGNKVFTFRKEKGLSQLEFETLINASPGSVSRIEKGKTIPTKETLFKIAKVLKLNKFEIDYLIGITAYPASSEEINDVVEEYKEYFSKKGVFGYIADERSRVHFLSAGFRKLLKLETTFLQKISGHTLAEIMLYPEFKINQFIRTDDYERLLKRTLSRFYFENHFMKGDKYYERAIKAVNSDPIAKKVWKEIEKNPPKNVNVFDSREVKFKVLGIEVKMVYSAETIYSNSRFILIEYTPTNAVMKLISKLG